MNLTSSTARIPRCYAFLVVAALLVTASAISVGRVSAGTFSVVNTNDSGVGSFRDAITQANAAGPGPHTIDIQVNGTVTLFTPLPSVTNHVQVIGVGTIDYSGATSVGGATLQLGTNERIADSSALTVNGGGNVDLNNFTETIGSLAGAGNVTLGSGSLLTGADNTSTTFSGVISGMGSVTKQGSGTLTLSGANTYTGETTVSDGTLTGTTISLQGNITNNANVTFDQVFNGTYASIMTGTGTLAKDGLGQLTLTGANTYSGATDVNFGSFVVNGSVTSDVTVQTGATLGGTGSVGSTVIDGIAAPGNSIGTLTVNGSYTQNAGSTYQIEINDGGTTPGVNNDLIDVMGIPGTATINGGTADIQATPGTYVPGTTYTIIQSTGGVFGAGYSTVTDNLVLRDFTVLQNANTVELIIVRTPGNFAATGFTPNQQSIGVALDAVTSLAIGDMGDVLDELLVLSAGQQRTAFAKIGGELHGTVAVLGLQNTSQMIQTLSQQLRQGSTTFANGAFTANVGTSVRFLPSPMDSGVQLASYQDLMSENTIRAQNCCCPILSGWAVGYGLGGDAQSDGNAAGLDYSVGGTLFGMQRELDNCTIVGVYGGYARSHVHTNGPNQTAQVDGAQVGGYLQRDDGTNYYILAGGFGYDDYDSFRTVTFGGINRVARGNYTGEQAVAYLERGVDLCWHGYRITPLAALQYIYLHQNGFTESGAGALNLTVNDLNTHSLRGLLGARVLGSSMTSGSWNVTPEFRAVWMHEFMDDTSTTLNARFNTAGAPAFAVQGLDLGRDWAVLGTGMNIKPSESLALYMKYDIQFNANQTFHIGSGGFECTW